MNISETNEISLKKLIKPFYIPSCCIEEANPFPNWLRRRLYSIFMKQNAFFTFLKRDEATVPALPSAFLKLDLRQKDWLPRIFSSDLQLPRCRRSEPRMPGLWQALGPLFLSAKASNAPLSVSLEMSSAAFTKTFSKNSASDRELSA